MPFALLDELEFSILALNREGFPVYLSRRGAELLRLKGRRDLSEHLPLLAPFIEVGKREIAAEQFRNGVGNNNRVEEVILETAEGLPLPLLAYARHGNIDEERYCLVVFFDQRPYEPILTVLEQSRRTRAALVLCASILDKALGHADINDLIPAFEAGVAVATRPTDFVGRVQIGAHVTDFMSSLTRAIELVDQLVPPSFRIGIEASATALLSMQRGPTVRILAHALLEASDFAGPYGRARVRPVLQPEGVQFLVLAARPETLPFELSPVELYLYRKCIPTEYRVLRKEMTVSASPQEIAFCERHLGKGKIAATQLQSIVAFESYSENLRIAQALAERENVAVLARSLAPSHFALSVLFPYAGKSLTGETLFQSGVRPAVTSPGNKEVNPPEDTAVNRQEEKTLPRRDEVNNRDNN